MIVDGSFTHNEVDADKSALPMGENGVSEIEQIVLIALDDIDDTDRLRPVDQAWSEAIATSLKKDGQLQPIDVCRLINQASKKPFRLVYGGHRVRAARIAGWTHIKAVVRSAGALDRRMREISENFFKANLGPIDQARFVIEFIETEKARLGIDADKDGRQMNADARSSKAQKKQVDDDLCILNKSFGLQATVAARLGLNQTAVSRFLSLNGISPSLLPRIRALPIGDNASALRKIASLDPKAQEKAVTLIEQGKAKGLAEAMAVIEKRKPVDADAKRLSTFVDSYSRMSTKQRRAALEMLRSMGLAKFRFDDEGKPAPANDRPNDVVDVEELIERKGGQS